MKRLFIIYTPYQLMASINLINRDTQYQNIIVFVQPNLEKYFDLCCSLQQTQVYIEKSLYTKYNNISGRQFHVKMVKRMVEYKSCLKKIKYVDASISEIIVPSDDIACRCVFHRIKKLNKEVKLSLIDDGLGSYVGKPFKQKKWLGQCAYSLILNNNYEGSISKIYVYQPDFLQNVPQSVTRDRISFCDETRKLFYPMAENVVKRYKNRKVIFLDQGLSGFRETVECLNLLKEIYKKDEVIVKIHPRVTGTRYDEFITSNDGLPFEIILAMGDLKDAIIISHSSGGCFTQYLISNDKPKAVLLTNMNHESMAVKTWNRFFLQIKKQIPGNNIFLPKDRHELECYLLKEQQGLSN